MKSYKRMALNAAIILVCLGCVGAGAWLVLEGQVTPQPLSPTLSSALVSARPSVTAPTALRQESGPSLSDRRQIQESYARIPLSFEANQGQTDSSVKYLARGHGYTLFLAASDAVLSLRSSSSVAPGGKHDASQRRRNTEPRASDALVRMRLLGANAKAAVAGERELPGKANYFIGNNPKQWRTNVPTYSQVRYRDVYPGIDLVYYGNQGGQLQYDFVVAPGAEPQAIALAVGAGLVPAQGRPQGSPLRIARDGDLVIAAQGGELRFRKPVAYQAAEPATRNEIRDSRIENRRLVEARFTLDTSNRVHFALGPYDRTQPLVIDPSLLWSTFLGGSSGDAAYGIAVDSLMNVYVAGNTASSNFPTANPLSNQSVSEDQSSTTYSGTGLTGSKNAFVTKLSWSGSALTMVYSTYLGGSGSDSANGIAVDSSGNAYVVGTTSSIDFPITNPILGQAVSIAGSSTCPPPSETICLYSGTALTGSQNAFVAELSWANSTLSLVFSTYLGGGGESGQGIALLPVAATKTTPASENIYVTGYTNSADFPVNNPLSGQSVLEDTFSTTYSGTILEGTQNAFVAELNWATPTLSLVYSTYLGGGASDAAYGIAVDSSGTVYVAGTTTSANFPIVNPVDESVMENGVAEMYSGEGLLGSFGNAFVSVLSWASATSTLSLPYSTYLSGGQDTAYGIAVDSHKNAYITGTTASTTFPTFNALQTLLGAGATANAFVAELNPWAATAGQSLVYSTYLGGNGYDVGYGIALDSSANAYVSGYTSSSNFPVANPTQKNESGTGNAFISELSWDPKLTLVFSTYLGAGGDYGYGIAVDKNGNTYVAGETHSSTFTSSANHSLQSYGGGLTDAFAAEISASSVTPPPSGTAGVTLSASTLAFGNQQELTTSSTKSVKLTSSGTGSLTISSITLTGTDPGDYAFAPGTKACPYNSTGGVLASAAVCYIYVYFAPTTTGSRPASVTITDNASTSPQKITLTGTGTSTPTGLKTTTTITSATPNPVLAGAGTKVSVSLKATGSPTGTITVSDGTGDQCIITLPATGCTLTPTTAGSKTLTAAYSGDTTFSASTSAGYSLTVEGFTITTSPGSQTVAAGKNSGFQVIVTSVGGFSGKVSISCGVVPSGPGCTVLQTPVSVSSGSGSATSNVAITTSAGTTQTVYTVTITGKYGTGIPATGGMTETATPSLTVN